MRADPFRREHRGGFDDGFGRQFARTQKTVLAVFIINLGIGIALLGGLSYVVYLLLRHFGIV